MKTIILFQNNDIKRTPDTWKMLIELLQSKITRTLSEIFDYIRIFEYLIIFEYIRILFQISNNIRIRIRSKLVKRILFVFVFGEKKIFVTTLVVTGWPPVCLDLLQTKYLVVSHQRSFHSVDWSISMQNSVGS